MKIALWIVGVLLSLIVVVFGLQVISSERVEVVELHTIDSSGQDAVTRLWLVDYEGTQYLRAGHESSGWYMNLRAHPEISVSRHHELNDYIAVPRPELNETINKLMHEKYTWGDTIIGIMFANRDSAIPVELVPR